MICDSCGTANQAGANFCIQCGTRLASGCPVCGHANLPSAHFCANCGSELPAIAQSAPGAAAAPPIAMAVAERRLVSVLFADLVGFTTRSEDRDPEETRELLSRYFEVARRIVEGHGGTIEKFIGDAVMAVWGAPTAHEDDAERAVRSALAIVAGVGSIADGDVPLHARAAVLTGEAAVTVGAEGQGMVAGRHGQHRQPPAVGGAARARCWWARPPIGPPAMPSATSPRGSGCSRARPRPSRPGERCRGRRAAAAAAGPARWSRRSWAGRTSCSS